MGRNGYSVGTAQYRNRVRGLLSLTRERGFGIDDATRSRRTLIALRSILVDARHWISPESYSEHLAWLHKQTSLRGDSDPTSIGRSLLFENLQSQPTDFASELRWCIARLVKARSAIQAHVSHRHAVTRAILLGDYEQISSALDLVERELGDSHWLLSTRLFSLAKYKGIDAQKTFLSELRRRAGRCISSTYAYYVSMRNEPSVSMTWFRENVRKRGFVGRDPGYKAYLRYALLRDVPDNSHDSSHVLRLEQAHSDVDLYETVIDLCPRLYESRVWESHKECMIEALLSLRSSINDPRLTKILLFFGAISGDDAASELSDTQEDLSQWREQSLAEMASDELADLIADDPVGALRRAAFCASRIEDAKSGDAVPAVADDLVKLMLELALRSQSFSRALADLDKLASNTQTLTFGNFMGGIVDALTEPTLLSLGTRLSRHSWTSQSLGILDRMRGNIAGQKDAPGTPMSEVRAIADAWTGADVRALPHDVAAKLSRLVLAKLGIDEQTGLQISKEMLNSQDERMRNWARVIALELYAQSGSIEEAIDLIAKLEVSGELQGTDLPISIALSSLRKQHLRQLSSPMDAAIALNALLRLSSDSSIQSLQRMAFNTYLKSKSYVLPSDINDSEIQEDFDRHVYFLRYVCVPHVMDMSPSFSSSNDILEERRKICARLRAVDAENRDEYDAEIVSITKDLSVWEGLKLVDGSRVHVDEEAFIKASLIELEGSFSRYLSLVQAGVGVADNFDVVLRNIVQQQGFAEGLTIPQNEADELLAGMVFRLKDLFLSNTIYGLDGYLSKRIRHGSLIGHLRGPVERHGLITQREKAGGRYLPHTYWLQRAASSDDSVRERVQRALEDFSRAFDREILAIKDERLQIRSKSSEGVMDIKISPTALHLIRSAVKADPTLLGLIRSSLVVFWTLLAPALEDAKQLLRVHLNQRLSEIFHRLQSSVSAVAKQESWHGEFANAYRLAQEETQLQIAIVSGWFERTDGDDHTRIYSLNDAIDIGVESAKLAFPGFDPYVVRRGDTAWMPGPSIQFFADIMLIVIGNVCRYSGMGTRPSIDIEATVNREQNSIKFKAVNAVAPGVKSEESLRILDMIRQRIFNQEFEPYVGGEDKSGLLKLAAMVHQSNVGKISFELHEDSFELEFTLSFIFELLLTNEASDADPNS